MSLSEKSILDPEVIQCPYPYYDALRRERPVAFLPELNAYFVSSYEITKLILKDPRFHKGSKENDGRKFVVPNDKAKEILLADAEIGLPIHCISQSNGEVHAQFRRLVEPFIGRRGAMAREPLFQSCVDALLDQVEKSDTCEVVGDFSSPLAIHVTSEIIGFPKSLYDDVLAYALASLNYLVYVVPEAEAVEGAKTMVRMHGIIRELIAERRKNPKDDFLTALANATVDGVPLTAKQMCYILNELVTGGHDTTANALSGGLMHLAQNPELQETLRKNPDQITNFVEEVLRAISPIQAAHRIALEDVDYGGVTIKPGFKVFLGVSAANRDEAKFECPAKFDHTRPDVAQHVAFGGGSHICAGAYVSRTEQRIAFAEWLKRFSSIEMGQPVESVEYLPSFSSRAPKEVRLRMKKT